ncbi:hypothetical protein EUGRSUZ_C02617 [Eucalyptus grandis]|uniref:Uncharacterized protein n=2 Tax=Eucalyptus grandis TaxID=71139 RepID=A0ACC3LGQ7_EUCGR|nr:hypothetical protein EUGRSUZ_C02617 [Eucalyptus grandis]
MIELQGFIHHHSLFNTESFFYQFLLCDYKFRATFNLMLLKSFILVISKISTVCVNAFQLYSEQVIFQIANFSDPQCKSTLYQNAYIGCSLQGY